MRPLPTILSATVFALASWIAGADALAESSLAERVLGAGWEKSLSSLKTAEQLAAAADGKSPEVDRALMLVYVRHSRFDRAAAIAERIAGRETATPHDLRNVAWLRMVTKEYPQASSALAELAKRVKDAGDEIEQEEMAAFLGRQLGFLAGPVRSELTLSQRSRTERVVKGALTTDQQAVMQSSSEAVLEEFDRLTTDKTITEGRAQLDAEEEQIRKLEDLEKQRTDLSQQMAQLEESRAKIKTQADAQKAALSSQQQTALLELSAADRELTIRQTRLNRVLDDIRFFEFRLSQEEDPFVRNQLLAELRGAESVAARYGADVREAIILTRAAAARKADLDQQLAVVVTREAQELAGVERELSTVQRRDRGFAAQQSRARRTLDPKLGASQSLGDQATALTTYDAFPLELERKRLLRDLGE